MNKKISVPDFDDYINTIIKETEDDLLYWKKQKLEHYKRAKSLGYFKKEQKQDVLKRKIKTFFEEIKVKNFQITLCNEIISQLKRRKTTDLFIYGEMKYRFFADYYCNYHYGKNWLDIKKQEYEKTSQYKIRRERENKEYKEISNKNKEKEMLKRYAKLLQMATDLKNDSNIDEGKIKFWGFQDVRDETGWLTDVVIYLFGKNKKEIVSGKFSWNLE